MNRSVLRASTALTVSLSLLQPTGLTAQANSNGALAERAQICVADPSAAGCEELLLQAQLCAEGADLEGCDVLLEALPGAGDPTPQAVPEEVAPEAEPAPEPEPEVAPEPDAPEAAPAPQDPAPVDEAPADIAPLEAPADAEPLPDDADAAPDVDAAPEPGMDEPPAPAPRDEAEADAPDPQVIDEAPVEEAPELDATPEAEAPVDEAPVDTAPVDEAPTEDTPAPDAPVADEPVTDDAPAAEIPAEDAPAADEATAPETAEDLFELLGDDVPEGVEAPEVIEAQPEAERFEAPPEPAAEPSAEEAAVIEQMLAEPETADAIDTLSRALGFGVAETEAPPAETESTETETTPEPDVAQTEEPTQQPDITPALPAAAAGLLRLLEGEQPEAEAADVIEQTITEETSRSSQEDFATTLSTDVPAQASRERDGLSNFERAGLVALGAVAVGMLINNNRVVATADDRVVVDRGQGNLSVWKDDNAILRQPGVVERTERFTDGSTLSTLERPDGTEIVTIRDATGRVLRRDRIELDGSRTQLFDDTRPFERVSVSTLPEPRLAEVRINERTDPALLRALLAEAETQNLDRTYSLTQVREIRELRELAPEILSEPVTFATASAVVRPSEAAKLVQLGRLMQQLIAENPREVFLIEGHTDAVGSAAYNLALSDRRAESVALALSEYFGVPPENMVVQGYGKRFLKVPTLEAEPQNRRVAVRRVSWLIH